MTKKNSEFENKVDAFEARVEKGIQGWVKNDTIFNGFRNTPARILLAVITIGVLYGMGAYAFLSADAPAIWSYVVCLWLVGMMQKLSVRFVFDEGTQIDEYQRDRRDRAFRTAYKHIARILSLMFAVLIFRGFANVNLYNQAQFWPFPNGDFVLRLGTPQVFVGLVFVYSLFVLQKYLSWGFKGEPWEDTARKK